MSHVMNVRWLWDDSRLLTVGGNDCALFQWRRHEKYEGEEESGEEEEN